MTKMHQPIDWFSWLSKTGLGSSLIYEYGMAFSRNELEEDDITYFNHEFLQSMGISIAKHRLEILKLARKQKASRGSHSHPISKLIIAIKKTKRTLASYFQRWVRRDDESALVLVRKNYGWKGTTMLKRKKRFASFNNQASSTPTLLLTNSYHKSDSVKINNFASPLVYDLRYDNGKIDSCDGDVHGKYDHEEEEDGGGGYWCGDGVQKIKWDAMFHDLKPT